MSPREKTCNLYRDLFVFERLAEMSLSSEQGSSVAECKRF